MAKKCPVRSLSDSSLGELANVIVSTIGYGLYSAALTDYEQDITVVMVEINSYMAEAGATSSIYQDLLRIILASDYLEASIRFTCLQTLLNCGVQILITENFPISYYEKILQVIAAQGVGIRTLNLKGVWVKEEHMHYMFEIVKKCRYLTKLYIPYIANDELLEVIGSDCRNLRVLNIAGETDITDMGVTYLSRGVAKNLLTVIDIGMLGEENICHSDVAVLIENCPNLETLGTYSYVGLSLKFIYDNVDQNFKCKLRYLHDTRTNLSTLHAIVKICPDLESIYIDTPQPGILHKLKSTNLRKLKLHKFQSTELMDLLETIGRTLTHLTIIRGNGAIELGKLARICSGLQDLDCYTMDMITYTMDIKFEHLEGLEMSNSPMHAFALKRFICNSTTLKRLAVDHVIFSDDDINSIFIEHDFDQLEDIWFTSAPNLTEQTVETLMDRCPELQSIGQLSGWALTPDDLALIKGMLKSGNSALVLSPSTFFP